MLAKKQLAGANISETSIKKILLLFFFFDEKKYTKVDKSLHIKLMARTSTRSIHKIKTHLS